MLAFKQATSMSVLARVKAGMHASLYQIVPSIMIRVKVNIHAERYQIVLLVSNVV